MKVIKLMRTKRIFTRTEVRLAPSAFLLVIVQNDSDVALLGPLVALPPVAAGYSN